MSRTEQTRIIPARLTVAELAALIARDPSEIEAVLRAREEPAAPDEVIGADLAITVAQILGVQITVEPRDLALEQLYELETRGEVSSDVGGRAGSIVDGVVSNLDELDSLIESVSERWSVARMPVIDRNILRIGVHELQNDELTPTGVVVSEAIRLANAYSTEKSAGFVNGVLATLAKTIRGD